MKPEKIKKLLLVQEKFFQTKKTFSVRYRIQILGRLYNSIQKYEKQIIKSLNKDLGKSTCESYMCEIGLVLQEISYLKKRLYMLTRDRYVSTHIGNFPAISKIVQEPYGKVLVIAPWNYPFLLSMQPMIGAVASGNTVVIKTSEFAPATANVIQKIIRDVFSCGHVAVVQGEKKESAFLLEQRFDYIFFTGSASVGKIVMNKAAKHLTPVTLELGGKSPCVVDETVDLRMAARRIAFGKCLNCGQTCIAPDYVLIHEKVKDRFLQYYAQEICKMYGKDPIKNKDYGRIVNRAHYDRLCGLIDENKIVFGGQRKQERLQIAPTVLDGVFAQDKIMQEEIFGPILPILTFRQIKEAIDFIVSREKPLACYVFTNNKKVERYFNKYVSFGGGCINDTMNHIFSEEMHFGGVGESGMGSYHGKATFQTFSHEKSVLKKSQLIDLPIRYQPYKDWYQILLHKILK